MGTRLNESRFCFHTIRVSRKKISHRASLFMTRITCFNGSCMICGAGSSNDHSISEMKSGGNIDKKERTCNLILSQSYTLNEIVGFYFWHWACNRMGWIGVMFEFCEKGKYINLRLHQKQSDWDLPILWMFRNRKNVVDDDIIGETESRHTIPAFWTNHVTKNHFSLLNLKSRLSSSSGDN